MPKEKWIATPEVNENTDGEITIGCIGFRVSLDSERIEWNVNALRRSSGKL